jgi:hypothetical protein
MARVCTGCVSRTGLPKVITHRVRWGAAGRVDGVSGTDLYNIVLDTGIQPRAPAAAAPAPGPEPSTSGLLLRARWGLLELPVAVVRDAGSLLLRPQEGWERVAALARGGTALFGGDPSLSRRSFNDVVLAAVTAGVPCPAPRSRRGTDAGPRPHRRPGLGPDAR